MQPELTFWMHAYGSGINTLDVGVSTSATGPFTSLYAWTGPYQADELDPWYQVGVDLTVWGKRYTYHLHMLEEQLVFHMKLI